jgi:predicted DNA-binding transcriptional regulator AlpA
VTLDSFLSRAPENVGLASRATARDRQLKVYTRWLFPGPLGRVGELKTMASARNQGAGLVAFPTEGRIMSITSQVEIPQTLFLKARQVRARYGDVSHMWLVRRQNDAGFPSPTILGGIRFWKISELERWEKDQKSAPRIRTNNLPKATANNPAECPGVANKARGTIS